MKTIQNPKKTKSLVKLSEVIKIILLMFLATAILCFEYYLGRSKDNGHTQNHNQGKVHVNAGIYNYTNYELDL